MIYLILAIIVIVIANIIKVYRQALFIEPYEKVSYTNLTQALAIGNLINVIFPFKIGYIVRCYLNGKQMKNGASFSLATIVVEIFLDFIFASLIYVAFWLLSLNDVKDAVFYIILLFIFLGAFIILTLLKKQVKFLVYKIASLFNNNLELKILKFFWFSIISFENIVARLDKAKLTLYSIAMWVLNILSCFLLAKSLTTFNINMKFYEMFNMFFSTNGLCSSVLLEILKYSQNFIIIVGLYCIMPSLIMYIISYKMKNKDFQKHYIEILPHINMADRLAFLEQYFNGGNSAYFKKYIELNNDVAIIEDYSAGSNATTMLCNKDGNLFYRKYSFGKDASKLYDQVKWIHAHEKRLTLTKIDFEYYKDDVCCYDMPYVKEAVTCFNYVHTSTMKEAWSTLKAALIDIDKNLHSLNRRAADKETIEKYISTKVDKNIEKIEKSTYLKPLLKNDYVYINGKKYHNLAYYKKYLTHEHLYEIFKNDYYADIHGDLTIENIICVKNNKKNSKNYYIIDPNTGNLHDSPYLDYGKLLQSIHGGYEFLMNTKQVSYDDEKIEFLFTKSSRYYELYNEYTKYLLDKFKEEGLKSIFYHEIIHWLRLMPYKIEKNGERCIIFYAGLIMVLADVEERFEK